MDLQFFNHSNILESTLQFFSSELDIKIAPAAKSEINLTEFLKEQLTDSQLLGKLKDARFVGMINNLTLDGKTEGQVTELPVKEPSDDYDMLLVFGVELNENNVPTKTDISRLTRALNRRSFSRPVVLILKYGSHISFSSAERGQYKRAGQQGEKIGRISILRDINTKQVHAGHERILLQLRINPLKVSTFKELYAQWLEVFNVNILNKEFYNELFTWYLWAVRTVSFPNRADDDSDDKVFNSENVIRLLTRLIFIWFVKEKGLVPETLFDKNKITETLKAFNPNAGDNSDYYKAILQNMFFATLNTEMPKDGGNRTFIDDKKKNKNTGYTEEYMDHLVFRYKNLFSNPDNGLKLFETIPFLNGGLFECLDRRDPETNIEMRIDGFSSTPSKQPVFPNVLFFGRNDDLDLSDEFENSNKYKHCKARGIINILNSYKFTIEENTPLEQEIALDPELLGKIFENLLASYNPETRTTARKQTGSYYTPREIVNYMVDESLIAYLKTSLNCDSYDLCDRHDKKEKDNHENQNNHTNHSSDNGDELESKLRQLFAYESEENPFNGDNETTNAIISHLSECKILDPACGSGAFPMGILHKMVFALGKLDPCNYTWKQAQLEKAQRDKKRAQQFEDETLREVALKSAEDKIAYVEASFGETGHELDYARKLFLIENCIYGVDIQQIAVQISKLRFFISLMVDQRVDNSKPNRNILSLPNLETKFVAANTLIPVDKPQQLMFKDPDVEKTEKELHEIHQKIFFTRNYSDKKKLKNKELQTRHSLRKLYVEKAGYSKEAAEKITQWNPFDPLKAAPFFDPEVMFTIENEKQGGYFDIVIGNPPYIQLQKIKKIADELSKLNYKSFIRTGDIYCMFYERGYNLLNKNGSIILITNSTWLRTAYGEKLKEFLIKNTSLLKVIDLADCDLFENAAVLTTIIHTGFGKKGLLKSKGIRITKKNQQAILELGTYFQNNYISLKDFKQDEAWSILDKNRFLIKTKVAAQGEKLTDWKIEIFRGILTGYNEAFIINGETKDKLTAQDEKNAELLKPLLRGKDILRYKPVYDDLWIIGTFPAKKISIKEYPLIKEYLEGFGKQLHQIGETFVDESGNKVSTRKKTSNKWFETQDQINYFKEFEKEKIIFPNMTKDMPFVLDNNGFYTNQKCFIITGEKLKYLVSIFNSKLYEYCFRSNFPELLGGVVELSKVFFEKVPIKYPSIEDDKIFEKISDKLHQVINKSEKEFNTLSDKIDLMVYKLYTLTYDECKIVDPEIEKLISREDYERMSIEQLSEL
ncbi:MAG: Eco57I restriction-modification methylase domain-containing protein [Prolixibacteraceae bacterium]|nr:Eco57I restriction-modification methylase domain-containing protein [Prolixibacteraceae bacterium]MBN2821137.1 Eco57I restriction-modification methylase domain-containing protein [Bacteroidales bacterium]